MGLKMVTVIRETFAALNIHLVTTSFYRPQANGLIERYNRTAVDIVSKKVPSEQGT